MFRWRSADVGDFLLCETEKIMSFPRTIAFQKHKAVYVDHPFQSGLDLSTAARSPMLRQLAYHLMLCWLGSSPNVEEEIPS